MASTEETLDQELARERLNAALSLQYRSALGYTLASGSLFGFEHQALGDRLWEYGQAELADARLLVEKIVALEGEPTAEVARPTSTHDLPTPCTATCFPAARIPVTRRSEWAGVLGP
jgi:bacterioferritin (cytochrome b1)